MEQYLFPSLSVVIALFSFFGFRPRFITRKHGLKHAIDNPATRECTSAYKKSLSKTLGILLACTLPNFLLCYYYPLLFSLPFAYLMLWFAAWFCLIPFRLLPRYIAELWAVQNREAKSSATPPRVIDWPMKIVAFLFILIALAGISLAFYIEFGKAGVTFNETGVSIEAPFFSTQFSKDDIQSITTTSALPLNGKRIMGSDTPKSAYGQFSFDGVGKAELMVNHGIKPIIVITLKDRTIFLNGKTYGGTMDYYKALTGMEKPQSSSN